jgi:dihydrofolate synthase/folylpolyglutamate synthase
MEQLPMFQRIGKQAYRPGLENTIQLDAYFGHPHTKFKTIHIAGTNGKGSVSHMLASVLQQAGYKTGLYTSPHLVDFRERIRINGKMISRKFIADFIRKHRPFFETFDPSFFEISVFMAFLYFKQNNVDVAVIEVGLGGRLDATNIISPVLSVITNIGRDHTEILGDTIEEIAIEKAGIIKENTPIIIGESHPETKPVFLDFSSRRKAPIIFAEGVYHIDYSMLSTDNYQVFNVKKSDEIQYTNLKCGLLGHYQRKNTVTLLAALEVLRSVFTNIHDKAVYDGIKNVIQNTGLQGRWQLIRNNPKVICDTAHNSDGLKWVLQQVNDTPFKRLHLIIGFVNDKDTAAILKTMPANALYYFVRLSVPRTMDETVLASQAAHSGLKGHAYSGISGAYEAAIQNAEKEDLIVVTGSNFLVADFLELE